MVNQGIENTAPAQEQRERVVIAGGLPSSRIALLGAALASVGVPLSLDALDRLNRPRTLTREEALAAFKPSEEDNRRLAAADAKRARKAAKLRRINQ